MFDPLGRAPTRRTLRTRRSRLALRFAALTVASLLPSAFPGLPLPGPFVATPQSCRADDGSAAPSTAHKSDRDPTISAAIADLGSDDFDTREKAARFLFSQGDAAVPALREAAAGDDPEVARRANLLLDNLASGLRPDSPKPVADLLEHYRNGNETEKREAAEKLASLGPPGVRVLTELTRSERDEAMKRILASDLGAVSRQTARRLIASGREEDLDEAGRLLATVAGSNEAAARDHAAFLVLRGKAREAIGQLSAEVAAAEAAVGHGLVKPAAPAVPAAGNVLPAVPGDRLGPAAMRLAYLCRAAGDLPAAVRAAEKSGGFGAPVRLGLPGGDGSQTTSLVEALRIEAGDWKGAAAQIEQRGNPDGSVESLGFLTAYSRLAGDTAAADRWARAIVDFANSNPGATENAANALLLNDRADEAIDLLKRHKDYGAAIEFLGPRLRFAEALTLLDETKSGGAANLVGIKARAAEALHFQGREKEARELLESAAAGDDGAPETKDWVALVAAAREIGQPKDQIDQWCVAALESYKPREAPGEPPGDPRPRLLERAGFQNGELAVKWWPILRARQARQVRQGGEEPLATFHQLRRLDENRWPGADLDLMAGELQAEAAKLPAAQRDERLMLLGETLSGAGRTEAAGRVYENLARVARNPVALQAVADFEALAGHWEPAAAFYARACATDPGQPVAQYLWGWALEQSAAKVAKEAAKAGGGAAKDAEGRRREGRERMARADLMALGDESARHALADAMATHGLADEARRERELLSRTAEFGSWELADALRQAGDEASKNDPLAAARFWNRSFLNNLSTRVSFTEPTANLLIPALVHHTRAKGLLREGKVEQGMKEADLSFTLCPGDADGQIDLVTDLQDHGRRAEADAIYRRALALYSKLRDQYPNSAPANNLVAWFEGRCHRDLDQALTCATKAAQLEPANTSILDTLAEVHFQRGEYDPAIELIRKCIELEPAVKHHRENLERFTKARESAGRKATTQMLGT